MREAARDVVDAKLPDLQRAKQLWDSSNDDGIELGGLTPLLEWGIAFCLGAQIELEKKEAETAV